MVEFISNIVGSTVNDFIDGAMVVLTIMIIWYCIKFFLVAPPTKEERNAKHEEDLERGKKFWGGVKEKAEKSKVEQEKKQKEDSMRLPKRFIVQSQQASEYVMELMRRASKKSDVKKIEDAIEDFEKHLHKSWQHLARARLNATKTKDKDTIHGIMLDIEGVKDQIAHKIKGKVPDFDPTTWSSAIDSIIIELGKARGTVHNTWNKIMNYHK